MKVMLKEKQEEESIKCELVRWDGFNVGDADAGGFVALNCNGDRVLTLWDSGHVHLAEYTLRALGFHTIEVIK